MADNESVIVGPLGVGFLAYVVGGFILRAIVPEEVMPFGWAGYAAILAAAFAVAYLIARRVLPAEGIVIQKQVWQPVMAGLIILAVAGLFFIVAFTAGLPSI